MAIFCMFGGRTWGRVHCPSQEIDRLSARFERKQHLIDQAQWLINQSALENGREREFRLKKVLS